MTVALLATGDEIVIGDTLNTNSQQLAHALNAEGISLGLHMTCGDEESQLHDCIEYLAHKHETLIITGGLGPTSDDRTRFALGRFMGITLVKFPEAMEHIQTRLRYSNLGLTPGNQQQALFPPAATLIPNPNGTAMGCYCEWQGKLLILLPGPPRECMPMFNKDVLPLLQKNRQSDQQLLKWRVFGVAESQIAQQLDDALAMLDCETGYRLETPYIECKVRCQNHLVETVKKIVDPIVAPHIIASPERKASESLTDLIIQKQIKLSIQDNITGGILQCLLQQPANRHLLKFGDSQAEDLHFTLTGLREYWDQHALGNATSLTISYEHKGARGEESHQLPYRSSLVVQLAAEWLSFRLLHLINQLH